MREPRKKARLAVSDPEVRMHLLELMVCYYHGAPTKYFSCDLDWFEGHLFELMLVQYSYRSIQVPWDSTEPPWR